MSGAQLLGLAINLSMALMVFGVALGADAGAIRIALRSPGLIARSMVAMYVVMPLVAVLIATTLNLTPALKVSLLLLALAPVPPVLPNKQIKAGGAEAYVLGLFAVAALLAIIAVPAGVAGFGRILGQDLDVPFGVTAKVVATSVLLPLVAGLVLARLAPRFANRASGPIGVAATVLLLLAFLPVLVVARHMIFAQVGQFTVLGIVVFTVIGLLTGHLLGGPVPANRTSLALATATRHPGVTLAILHVLNPDDKSVAPVVLLYLLVAALVSAPYLAWRKRAQATAPQGK